MQADDGLPDQICTTCVENLHLVDSFLTGCKRADEQLRNVVRRTMSTGSSFQSLKTEADVPKETTTKTRTRKQLISVRSLEQTKQYSRDPSKSLIRRSLDHEKPEIYDENETKEDLELPKKNNEAYLLVVDKLNLEEEETTDIEANEYILTENDDYDDIVSTIEPDEKLLNKQELESSIDISVYPQSELDAKDAGVASHAIDLGGACEPSQFPRHSCSYCGNSFPNQTQLNSHMRTHGNTRNYECE